jgi:hypothetical protein
MSFRSDDPERTVRGGPEPTPDWRTDPEVGAATGGHLSPDIGASGPMFDPLTDPVPGERSTRLRPREADDYQRESLDRDDSRPGRDAARRRIVKRRSPTRRVKRTIKHVDPISVLKMSLFYYAFFLVAWLILVAIIYSFVSSTGFFTAVEDFSKSMALSNNLDLTLGFFEKWAFLLGFVLYIIGCLGNLVLAFLYNVTSDVVGGVEVTFVERES